MNHIACTYTFESDIINQPACRTQSRYCLFQKRSERINLLSIRTEWTNSNSNAVHIRLIDVATLDEINCRFFSSFRSMYLSTIGSFPSQETCPAHKRHDVALGRIDDEMSRLHQIKPDDLHVVHIAAWRRDTIPRRFVSFLHGVLRSISYTRINNHGCFSR